eukprot:scaffold5753_cov122-Isochrysis_galbana.AAC.4
MMPCIRCVLRPAAIQTLPIVAPSGRARGARGFRACAQKTSATRSRKASSTDAPSALLVNLHCIPFAHLRCISFRALPQEHDWRQNDPVPPFAGGSPQAQGPPRHCGRHR